MKWIHLGLIGTLFALASCDTDVVRFDPQSAPKGDEAGLHVVLERFTKDTAHADIWLEVTNTTAAPITLKAPACETFWAQACVGDQQAMVEAQRWSRSAATDDIEAKDAKDLHDPYVIVAGAKREIELRCHLARPLPSAHEPWKLVLFIDGRGSIELPIADPQLASAHAPAQQ